MNKRTALTGLLAVALAAVAAVAFARFASGDVRELAFRLDVVERAPFTIRLSGPLWRDRTLQDAEGVPDVAFVTADESLVATIAARGRTRPAEVELRVDGRVQRRVKIACHAGRCGRMLRLQLVPRLRAARGGNRHVEIRARASSGRDVSVASLDVRVMRRLPATVEVERSSLPVAPPADALRAGRRRVALALVASARRTGALRALVGTTRLTVRAAGTLRDGPRIIGATLFLQLVAPRRDVAAVVPGYVSGRGPANPYVPRASYIRVSTLRDLLIDLDLRSRRIISIEPGPASTVSSWANSDPSAREGVASSLDAVSDVAARAPKLLRVSDRGPAFLGYDGELGLDPTKRDWAVSIVFAGHANIGKVKDGLRKVGLTRRGGTHYLAYQLPGAGLRFDGDKGLKTHCDSAGTDIHTRLYAPAGTDRFTDPEYGSVVVATAHLDHADGCGTGTPRFGFSAEAEREIATRLQRLGWRVERNALALGNPEPYRRDVRDPSHIWLGDGRATLIWVP